MRTPAYLEFRCREHERRTDGCGACAFVQSIEQQIAVLDERRRTLLLAIKARLGEGGDLVLVNLR